MFLYGVLYNVKLIAFKLLLIKVMFLNGVLYKVSKHFAE